MRGTASGPRRSTSISGSSTGTATRWSKVPSGEPGTDPANEFVLYVDGRRYCHRCIAQLPPEAREIYRNRVDQLAGRWYREGAARRDVALLRRVVEQAFCSSWGDDALELLGDLAFQDGRFGEALSFYGQLVADRAGRSVLAGPSRSLGRPGAGRRQEMAVPGGVREPARPGRPGGIRAAVSRRDGQPGRPDRQLCVDPGQGDRLGSAGDAGPARRPMADLRRLAATDADRARADRRRPGAVAGGPREGLDDAVADGPVPGRCRTRRPRPRPEQLLAFHPIVLGDQVMVCDGSRVLAYNLGDRPSGSDGGEARPVSPAWRHDPENGAPVAPGDPVLRRDPALHAHGGGPSDLRADGAEQHRST